MLAGLLLMKMKPRTHITHMRSPKVLGSEKAGFRSLERTKKLYVDNFL